MSDLFVAFKVAGSEYVLPASDVLQMETFVGATPVPGSPQWVLGLVQVRGRVIPVIDLRRRFGLPPQEGTLDSRIVVVQTGERVVGLLADAAREVLRIDSAEFHPPPEVVVRDAEGYVDAVARTGARLVMRIDFRKVIGEDLHG